MDEHNYYDNDGEYNDEVTEYNGGNFENIQALVELEAEHSTNMNNDMGQQQQPSSNMPTYDGELDETLVSEMKDIFALFDFKQTGTIATDDLGTILRGLGFNLTEEQVGAFVNENDQDGSGRLDFQVFYNIIAKSPQLRGPCTKEQAMENFKVFDLYHDGTIKAIDLVHLLRNLGEPLTKTDVDHLLREISIDGDKNVNIEQLVDHMLGTSSL